MDETKKDHKDESNTSSGSVPDVSPAATPSSTPTPADSAPAAPLPTSARPNVISEDIAEHVGLAPQNPPTSQTSQSPLPSQNNTVEGDLSRDIAHILEEVKLPERVQFRGHADIVPSVTTKKTETPAVETAPQTPAPAKDTVVTPVHTLKDDLQSVVREQKISVVRAAALEEDRRSKQKTLVKTNVHSVQKRRIVGIFIAIAVLTVLGLSAIAAVIMIQRERAGSEAAPLSNDSLLFSEQTVPFSIQNRAAPEIKRMFADARVTATLTLGAITQIAPTVEDIQDETGATYTRLTTTKEFLTGIGTHAPAELLRAFGTTFFFGFHSVDENAPLLVIPISSYERAFAGMLEWENSMNADLSPIFTALPALIQEDGLLKKRPFEDLVMRNYDVRALKDDSGEIQLYYSFPTRELLIIAESPYSFTEILSRLRADRRI